MSKDSNRLALFDLAGRDVRYAARLLRRTPAFSLTAIATLALAIGANAAVFSLANAILIRPLPYPEPERLAYVSTRVVSPSDTFASTGQDGQAWITIRDHASLLDAAVYGTSFGRGVNLVVGQSARIVEQQRVSAGYFHVLGVKPFIGREFSPDEDRPSGPPAAVLTYELWRQTFNADPSIVGVQILLRGEPHTVVGVMPEDFQNLVPVDVWTPVRATTTGEGGGTNFEIIARPKPGVSWSEADGQLSAISQEATRARIRSQDGTGATATLSLRPMQDALVEDARAPILMLSAAVGAVLLIACVNLAALLLARGGSRAKEIATRMALGSGRLAVIRQLMVEAMVLALLGGVLGLGVGWFGLEGLKALGGQTFEEWQRVSLDGRVVGMTMAMSIVTSAIVGLVPAWQASRLNVQSALTEGGSRAVAGGARHWPRRLLVLTEVSLGVVLLVVAGLLIRTFVNLRSLEPGFEAAQLTTTSASLLDKRYETPAAVKRLIRESLSDIARTPGVQSAAVSLGLPYHRLLNMGFRLMDVPATEQGLIANVSYVTPDFFATLGIPIRKGRSLSADDREAAEPVVVVNEAFARIYSKDRAPIERIVRIAGRERRIVGVVGDVQQRGAGFVLTGMTRGPLTHPPLVYLPVEQADGIFATHVWFQPYWTVRAASASIAEPAIREAVAKVDPLLPMAPLESLSSIMAESTAQQRLLMTLVGVLAAAAVLLSAIGIYGLISQSVVERTREFGIRLALGATAGQVVRTVALPGILLSILGALIGGGLSLLAVRLVQSFLWGVSAHDPGTYVAVAAGLLLVATVASTLPAMRLLRLDPARALRQ